MSKEEDQSRQEMLDYVKGAMNEGKSSEAATLDLMKRGVTLETAETIVAEAIRLAEQAKQVVAEARQFRRQMLDRAKIATAEGKSRQAIVQDLVGKGTPAEMIEGVVSEAFQFKQEMESLATHLIVQGETRDGVVRVLTQRGAPRPLAEAATAEGIRLSKSPGNVTKMVLRVIKTGLRGMGSFMGYAALMVISIVLFFYIYPTVIGFIARTYYGGLIFNILGYGFILFVLIALIYGFVQWTKEKGRQ